MKWMLMPLHRYADFEGRSRRMEYWMWVLFNVLLACLIWIPLVILFISAVQRVDDRGGVDYSSGSYSSRYDDYSSRDSSSYDDRDSDYDRDSDRDRYRDRDRYSYGFSTAMNIDPDMFVEEFSPIGWVLLGLAVLWWLVTLIPNLAVAIRRLHDTDKSGWMIFLGLIPLVGGIILLVFMFMEGTRGPNRFGPDPKGPPVGQTFA